MNRCEVCGSEDNILDIVSEGIRFELCKPHRLMLIHAERIKKALANIDILAAIKLIGNCQ